MARSIVEYNPSPTATRFHQSDAFVRALVGPIGSGKSVANCWEIWRRAQQQAAGPDGVRQSRWAVIRNTYRELADTTVKTWMDWFGGVGHWRESDMTYTFKGGGVHLEVMFRALDRPDDVSKLLSLELTGAWLNEAREIPKSVFDMVQGRVGRYPSKRQGGPTWFGVIMDTNPPDTDGWFYRVFEEDRPEGFEVYRQPSGLSPLAENVENLPPGYYPRLVAGKTQDWINVYVHGLYGYTRDGKPVHPEYRDDIHCREFETEPQAPLYIGMDFGGTPAATIAQFVAGQWRVLDELVTDNSSALQIAAELKALLRTAPHLLLPSGRPMQVAGVFGDPAGVQRGQGDGFSVFDILRANGVDAEPAHTNNDFTLRREALSRLLMKNSITGEPAFVLHPRCKSLRKALNGGYQYRRLQVSGADRYTDKPLKDMHSHIAESLHYLLLGAGEGDSLVQGETAGRAENIKRLTRTTVHRSIGTIRIGR